MTQPEGPLRAARTARGWSQSHAVRELMSLAAHRGVAVAAPLSLKTQLSRWENQHAVPDDHYRALLCELYDSTEAKLGLGPAPTEGDLGSRDAGAFRAALDASAALDESGLELLRAQVRTARELDSRLGAAAVAGSARAQLSYLEHALRHAVRPWLRRELARIVADGATLTGRLMLDQARHANAWHDYETAKAAAREAESPPLLGYVMAEQAAVLIDAGAHEAALSVVEQAVALATDEAPGAMRAWLAATRGVTLAGTGAVNDARSAFSLAERQLTERPVQIDMALRPIPIEFDMGALHRQRGHAHRLLDEQEAAIDDLEHALHEGGGSSRDITEIHIDLAYAHRAVGHAGAAAHHAKSARDLAGRIGSVRLAARLDAVPAVADPEPPTRS